MNPTSAKAANKPKLLVGMDKKMLVLSIFAAMAVATIDSTWKGIIGAVVAFVVGCFLARTVTARDPKRLDIGTSQLKDLFNNRYDSGRME